MNSFNSHISENMYRFTKDFKLFRNNLLSDINVPEFEKEQHNIENAIIELYKYIELQDKAVVSKYDSSNGIMYEYGLSRGIRKKFGSKK
ncbi:MAG: hypothetical protein DRQ78_10055 [Epsilonproteobacteria bacterium]|nr:MAG: hypothetical protein DRQ78_10055 [Campylobacterota bacterium]